MHYVCCRSVSYLFEKQLDLPQDSRQEVVRVHERIVPRYYGDGLQRLLENIQVYCRSVRYHSKSGELTLHSLDHQKDSRHYQKINP